MNGFALQNGSPAPADRAPTLPAGKRKMPPLLAEPNRPPSAQPKNFMSEQEQQPSHEAEDFIDTAGVLRRLPICRKTLFSYRASGKVPYVQIGRKVIYHWPSVSAAFIRMQRGGGA
jgi:hypothetical protein